MSHFSDPAAVARYAERPVRLVPGFLDLQRMAGVLLAERVSSDACVLVLGAGGGLELKAFAEWQPGWSFVGVDPSAEMLALAAQITAAFKARIELYEGYIESAPEGPFDAATCLLTLHFVPRDQRINTLIELRKRLKPGGPLVIAHHSFPQGKDQKALWLSRYAAFATASGVPAEQTQNAAQTIGAQLPVAAPEEDEAMLNAAGFTGVSQFYMGFTFRGWVAYAP